MRDGEPIEVEGDTRNRSPCRSYSSSFAVWPIRSRRALLVVDAGQLDDDLVAALLADLRLGDAGAVDSIVDDRDRVVEAGLVDRLALLRHGLLDHFEAALEVEAERRRPLERRSRQREQGNADEGRNDEAHQDEVRAPLVHSVAP